MSFCSIVCDKLNGSFKNIGLREGYNIKFVAERVNTNEDHDVDVSILLYVYENKCSLIRWMVKQLNMIGTCNFEK